MSKVALPTSVSFVLESAHQTPRGNSVKYRIIGDAVQSVAIELSQGDGVFARLGSLLFVKGAVRSNTSPQGPYWSAVTETLVPPGETPLVVYNCDRGGGLVGFRAPGPGRIFPIKLEPNVRTIVKRRSIIAATEGLQCDSLHLEGEDTGDVLPHTFVTISGSGEAFLHGAGNLVDFSLQSGEQMVIDGEMMLALEGGIDHAPKPVGKPGQEGPLPYIMLMQLTGPGRLILHTMRQPD